MKIFLMWCLCFLTGFLFYISEAWSSVCVYGVSAQLIAYSRVDTDVKIIIIDNLSDKKLAYCSGVLVNAKALIREQYFLEGLGHIYVLLKQGKRVFIEQLLGDDRTSDYLFEKFGISFVRTSSSRRVENYNGGELFSLWKGLEIRGYLMGGYVTIKEPPLVRILEKSEIRSESEPNLTRTVSALLKIMKGYLAFIVWMEGGGESILSDLDKAENREASKRLILWLDGKVGWFSF